jgi:hypothetical protein
VHCNRNETQRQHERPQAPHLIVLLDSTTFTKFSLFVERKSIGRW